jgi:hypothetical protein
MFPQHLGLQCLDLSMVSTFHIVLVFSVNPLFLSFLIRRCCLVLDNIMKRRKDEDDRLLGYSAV